MTGWHATAAAATWGLAIALAGCGSGGAEATRDDDSADAVEPQESVGQAEPEAEAAAAGGLTGEEIIAAIEPGGFECVDEEPRLSDRERVIQCRGDDSMFITATLLTGADLVPEQLDAAERAICDNEVLDAFRVAVSGAWVLVPGGDRDEDIAAFDAATQVLGLEAQERLC